MNKTILTLIERAGRKGEAFAYSYRDYYGNPEHVEKYHIINEGTSWKLFHYGTLTATVENGKGNVVYGESRSDLNSIETFLLELTGRVPEMHYYPSKDTFLVDGQAI